MQRTIVIIGAGFSGTATAAHLLTRHGREALAITLVNRHAHQGRGVAYGTHSPSHLLNVPAGRMSLYPERADDFLDFVRIQQPAITGGSFVARSLYGDYLQARLNEAAASTPRARLTRMTGEAIALMQQPHGATLELADGRQLQADRVVLAVGNYPPSHPAIPDHGVFAGPLYVNDPWAAGALDHIPADRPVFMLGTGLTMIDMALELDRRGFAGKLYALSRRGLTPQTHRDLPAMPQFAPPAGLFSGTANMRRYLRIVRQAATEAADQGHDWRDVISALRPVTPALWQALPVTERRRFLRHLQPYWDTHRHRTAPLSGARFQTLRAGGRLQILAGRLRALHPAGTEVEVQWQPRARERCEKLKVGSVINCTGPESRLTHMDDPLIQNLLVQGVLTPDPMQLGVATNGEGAALDHRGRPSQIIYYTGPLLRARDWECTAVPELRMAAIKLADQLALDG